MIKMNNNKITGFTFLELSMIIVIASLIMTYSLVINDRISDWQKAKETDKKLAVINQKLKIYFKRNQKLPCPADLSLSIYNGSFGNEELNGSTCDTVSSGVTSFGGSGSDEVFMGGVPLDALNLPVEYAFDAWHNKISYVVSKLSLIHI